MIFLNIQQNNELTILVNMSNAINQLIPCMIYNDSAQADSKLLIENVQTISELGSKVGSNPETLLLM